MTDFDKRPAGAAQWDMVLMRWLDKDGKPLVNISEGISPVVKGVVPVVGMEFMEGQTATEQIAEQKRRWAEVDEITSPKFGESKLVMDEKQTNRSLGLSRNDQFHKDFAAAFAQLNALAVQYDLPTPTVVFSYEWKNVIMQRLSPPQGMQFKHFGINFRFGQFRDNQTTFERF